MDDDGDMAEMYLTEKKSRLEASFFGDQSLLGHSSAGAGLSLSAPVSPVSSPSDSRKLEKAISLSRSRHDSMKSSESNKENIEVLEMLLEAYFVVIDSTLNKLTSVMSSCALSLIIFTMSFSNENVYSCFIFYFFQLKEYIDDTEDFINIQLVGFPLTIIS